MKKITLILSALLIPLVLTACSSLNSTNLTQEFQLQHYSFKSLSQRLESFINNRNQIVRTHSEGKIHNFSGCD